MREINNRFKKRSEKLGDINNELVNIRSEIKRSNLNMNNQFESISESFNGAVSYTHLDVYKRQQEESSRERYGAGQEESSRERQPTLDKRRRETADAGGETRTDTDGTKMIEYD